MKYPPRKKLKRIAEAVFRGKKSQYSFDVFPLTNDIEDSPAVFIFSRREIDKFGHGHHFVSCIGETDSVLSEVKRHKRNKCIKQNESNVVCILKEETETKRASVIEDLKLNRSFVCPQDADKSKMRPAKPYVHIVRPVKPVFELSVSKRRTAAKKSAEPVLVVEESPARKRPAKAKPTAKRSTAKAASAPKPSKKRAAAKPVAAAKPKAKPKTKRTAKSTVVASVPAPAKRSSSKTVTAAAPATKRAAAKPNGNGAAKPKSKAKRSTAERATRVQSSVDSDRRQHRLPKQQKPVTRRAKSRPAGKSRSRQKAAA
jgi:hypothetical protein